MMNLDNQIYKYKLKYSKNIEEDPDVVKNRIKVIKKYQKQLNYLFTVPKIVQKTPEWYKARENMISASDFAQALNKGKFGTQKQLIIKKVNPVDDFKSNMFFIWGNMFEQAACDIYSLLNNKIKIHDFGLIKHKNLDFFGASPDGISDIGIMLEIKCPLKRKITPDSDVPIQYYYQIQGQLEVCELDECDYFECAFSMYNNFEDFSIDLENIRGIILKKDGKFIYSPVYDKNETNDDWIDTQTNYDEIRCWKLDVYNLKRVYKDPVFLKENLTELKKIWDKICRYRNDSEAFEIEIKKSFRIDTEKLTGYIFRED